MKLLISPRFQRPALPPLGLMPSPSRPRSPLTAAVRAQQRHLEAAPPGLGRVHLHCKLGGLQAQRLAQGRGVAPVDTSTGATERRRGSETGALGQRRPCPHLRDSPVPSPMLDNHGRFLHSILAASQLLPLVGGRDHRRLGLPLPPAGSHGAWSPAQNQADLGRE